MVSEEFGHKQRDIRFYLLNSVSNKQDKAMTRRRKGAYRTVKFEKNSS